MVFTFFNIALTEWRGAIVYLCPGTYLNKYADLTRVNLTHANLNQVNLKDTKIDRISLKTSFLWNTSKDVERL